jgi:hypothetical protein
MINTAECNKTNRIHTANNNKTTQDTQLTTIKQHRINIAECKYSNNGYTELNPNKTTQHTHR